MPRFARKSSQPLRPAGYRARIRRIRELCDAIDANAEAQDEHGKRRLTSAVHGLSQAAQALSRKHSGLSVAQSEQHRADAYDAEQGPTRDDYDDGQPQ